MKAIITLVFALPLIVLGLAWESIWVDAIYQLVAPRYNWPTVTYTGWFAINGIVSLLCRGPRPKKTDNSVAYMVMVFFLPVFVWLSVRFIIWWVGL